MMKIIFSLFIICLSFASCKSKAKGGWPDSERKAFIENCEKSGAAMGDKVKSYCSCMLGKMEAKYPKAEDALKMDVKSTMDFAKDCLK